MAARLNKRTAGQSRDHIQTIQLIKLVQEHALRDTELSVTRIKAADMLLRKTLPDLKVTEHTGELKHLFPENVGVIGYVGDDGPDPEDTA